MKSPFVTKFSVDNIYAKGLISTITILTRVTAQSATLIDQIY